MLSGVDGKLETGYAAVKTTAVLFVRTVRCQWQLNNGGDLGAQEL